MIHLLAIFSAFTPVDFPVVGTVIDERENALYGLFDQKGFVQATVYQSESGYTAFVVLEKGAPLAYEMTEEEFAVLVGKIEGGVLPGAETAQRTDPNYTRLFVMPTGECLQKGKSYFADYELFLLWYSYGILDNLMISLGSTVIPAGLNFQALYAGPKIKLWDSGKGQTVSLGAHIVLPPAEVMKERGFELWSAGYFSVTSEKGPFSGTIGGGVLVFPEVYPGFFGGFKAGSGRIRFMAEYWHVLFWEKDKQSLPLYPEAISQWPNLILGCRFSGKNLSADLGLVYPMFPEYLKHIPIGIPLVNFAYNF